MSLCLEVDEVDKHYSVGQSVIETLRKITFNVTHKEFVCIIGPSGCGKSTLLRLIAGLDTPSRGEIRFHGENIRHPHHKISMIFQGFALFPWRNTIENIEFGLEVQGIERKERRESAIAFAEMVGLEGYEHLYPKQLSGGMKQRVGLARALAVDPDLVLMDEAFSSLDEFTAQVLRNEVADLWAETGKTFVLATHNLGEALELADRILVLSARPAKVKNNIPIELSRPRNKHDAQFTKVQRELFDSLREELKATLIRRKLKKVHEAHNIDDIEA